MRFVFLLTLLLSIAASAVEFASLSVLLLAHGIKMSPVGEPSVDSDVKRRGEKQTFETIVAQNATLRIEIESVSPVEKADAENHMNMKIKLVEKLYEDQVTPYHGEITNLVQCTARNKPTHKKLKFLGEDTDVFVGGASERYTFGVCNPDLLKQEGFIFMSYDLKTKTQFQFKIFVPTVRFEKDKGEPIFDFIRSFTKVS